ncbi:MAG: glycosyltransferase family 4 protein, partial [Planctomycetota bacterium]
YSLSDRLRFRLTLKLADLVIAGNEYLAEHARKLGSDVAVLPTGLNTDDYKVPAKPRTDRKIRLVWIGSKSTLKYLAEIKPVLEDIGSRFKNVVLRIIADEFVDLENMPVERRLWSRETEAADLAECDIGLAPLPDNRFTRGKCGYKILQYAAVGLPTVAAPVGVNAQYVRHGTSGFLATDKPQWIESLSTLIEEPEMRENMGAAARQMAADFDIAVIGKQLLALINDCIAKGESLREDCCKSSVINKQENHD